MKVVDLHLYRIKKLAESMQQRVSCASTNYTVGTIDEIKICFKEWLRCQDQLKVM